ncbi:cytidylate kinase-like family protein [Actinomadura macrotermitis]|uniref:Cytidylate kinase-like family protein n=1 Tax=Actinomadura macrotermitis TaxID=2585200 RepID=A0A7K0BZZ6_9ACTN|nr:hypothetical protein [Actinomadura macrotermitis]
MVTISAAYGAGGAAIGPAVAARLGLPFVDRAIPAAVAAAIGCPLEEALTHDGRAESGLGRILAGAARLPTVSFAGIDAYLPEQAILPEEEFVRRTERFITAVADGDGGVILGRAGAVVLADRPGVLHVRLDGTRAARLERAAAAAIGTPRRDVERMLDDNDRARAAYVKHFYGADPADPRLYHLVLDTVRLPEPAAVEVITAAAGAV